MHVTVVGTGYVGLVTGAGLADFGLQVVCVDKDEEKIETLRSGEIPFYEPGLKELVDKNVRAKRLDFSTDLAEAVRRSLVVFLAVGTPPAPDGGADLSQIREVVLKLADIVDEYKVVVTKSTVPVGTNRWIKRLFDEHKKNSIDIDVISNPEFLREGSAVKDFMWPNRVVIGGESAYAIAIVKDIYRPLYLIETPFVITNLETAELIKYASNAFLATKISFINEIANLCELVGADVHHVAKAMGLDGRIGPKFLHPGPGFGGSCFPKDIQALAKLARDRGYNLKIVEAVIEVNKDQRRRAVNKIVEMCGGEVTGKVIALLGLSFKPNTSDIREAPALTIVAELLAQGAKLKAYDPAAMEEFKRVFPPEKILYCDDPYQAAEGADCLVLVTEWNEFRYLDLSRLKDLLKSPRLVDLRNVYNPSRMKEMGFHYTGVGRG
ncbi:UDP-glucose/GDP-mannose dehydrogenase family protein [Thermosulfuriphilus ammonigenes]|uniref:UDP-glucose 6-dehydrogenase n=1 Tax=Thermosulfuriphilus ammonigenes TaxID=1936021 RepID=A0A6G7PUN2_9BACT|nr:UDP-glucose/GDP-mannose dehydrogenase family protein [Thermosulfuriphilus ammonigenes]MBA2848560.1 UDPglucose 6-dehydrogenase [Thermosulfuriphilus ammonigenes]QIJ71297.1 UDP-glucose/GDP-mannose dehydrogenase family protein [Thermosulfuriphilus ammonigenes]